MATSYKLCKNGNLAKFAQNYETCPDLQTDADGTAKMNGMRFPLVGLIFMILVSCGRRTPEGVIPEKQMPDLLLDVHMADGQLAAMPIDSARIYIDGYYAAIFDHYGVDSTRFANSIDYYSKHPEVMNEIYEQIDKRINAINAEQQRVQDSAFRVKRIADSAQRLMHLDSTYRVLRDSLDLIRKRQLLLVNGTDTAEYGKPVAVTYRGLAEHMLEQLRLRKPGTAVTGSRVPEQKPVKADTASAVPAAPARLLK